VSRYRRAPATRDYWVGPYRYANMTRPRVACTDVLDALPPVMLSLVRVQASSVKEARRIYREALTPA